MVPHSFRIPVMRPKLPSAEIIYPYLKLMDSSRIYSNWGPMALHLEEAYSNFFEVERDQVVAIANATLAITGCASVLGNVKSWVIPEFTFAATGLAIRSANKELFSFDINPSDYEIQPDSIEFCSRNNSGLVKVLPFGKHFDGSLFNDLSVPIIVDAAASSGARVGSISEIHQQQFIVFSLHATKVMGAGEGAIVVCGSRDEARKLKRWANFGFDSSRISQTQGFNAKISEVAAIYGLASINNRNQEILEWTMSLSYIKEMIADQNWSSKVSNFQGVRPYWIAQFKDETERNKVEFELSRESVESRRWWPQLMSRNPGINAKLIGSNSNAVNALKTTLGLPLWRDIDKKQIAEIVAIVSQATAY